MKKQKHLLNEMIRIGKENILDFDLNSTKFGEIMNKLENKQIGENQKKVHQKCITSISNEEFTNQMMKEINTGGLDEIYEILNEETDESANKSHSHSRHNTETFDYLRYSNYGKNNNIKEFQIDDRKTVDVFDKLHVYENFDDSDNDEDDQLKKYDNDEEENDLGAILGIKLEKFDKDNEGILLNENSKNLIENLKKDTKFVKTGTKIDFVEEIEGKIFNTKRNYKDLEKYILKMDNNNNIIENKNENLLNNKKPSKKIIYDMLSTTNNIKLYKEISSNKGMIFIFDKNNNIICSTEKGNILIYNLNEEKKLKELDYPFKEQNKNNLNIITAMDSDEKYIIAAYNNDKIAFFRKGKN